MWEFFKWVDSESISNTWNVPTENIYNPHNVSELTRNEENKSSYKDKSECDKDVDDFFWINQPKNSQNEYKF